MPRLPQSQKLIGNSEYKERRLALFFLTFAIIKHVIDVHTWPKVDGKWRQSRQLSGVKQPRPYSGRAAVNDPCEQTGGVRNREAPAIARTGASGRLRQTVLAREPEPSVVSVPELKSEDPLDTGDALRLCDMPCTVEEAIASDVTRRFIVVPSVKWAPLVSPLLGTVIPCNDRVVRHRHR